jgi:hypothetical protein
MAENNEYRVGKEPVIFSKLENAQNIKKITKIFANNKPNYLLKPNPYFVVIVGSPGVGKTTKIKDILMEKMGLKYEDFYNISLDSLVEKVKPYRDITKRLHNTLKAKRIELGESKLTNKNFALLSEVYLPTIMSKKTNFTLKNTEESKLKKIELIGKNMKPLSMRKKSEHLSELKSLNELREDGLKYAVMNGLNIIYDTTLTKTKDKIKENIMPILELNRNIKYNIIVILITASIQNIQKRIEGRHNKMLTENNSYIRAISPQLIEMFIKDNKEGFDKASTYFKSNKYKINKSNTFYTKSDFTFIEIENPLYNNKNNKNNNWKYF